MNHLYNFLSSFEELIEREWLQAGHPFALRNSKCAFAVSGHRTEAPVFLIFLDCVWQVSIYFFQQLIFIHNVIFLLYIFF